MATHDPLSPSVEAAQTEPSHFRKEEESSCTFKGTGQAAADSDCLPGSSTHQSTKCAVTEGTKEAVDPAVLSSATPDERAAAIEHEEAAAEAASKWPSPGPLTLQVEAQDGRARTALLKLTHGTVETPIFMPAGTKGAMKGVHVGLLQSIDKEKAAAGGTTQQENVSSAEADENVPGAETTEKKLPKPPKWFSKLIFANTFHLYRQVGGKRMREVAKGLHRFMRWGSNILTDSGGFQMISLCRMIDVFEEGVCFRLGFNGLKRESKSKKKQERTSCKHTLESHEATTEGAKHESASEEIILLTPEESIFMQNQIGSDIIMQLDHGIASKTPELERVEDAMLRSIRWLDRCIVAHEAPDRQALFGILQGGLDLGLRERALALLKRRACHGNAIGGLSGGESKSDFWQVINLCTSEGKGLPKEKPRYVMGVGYPLDIVVCVALGCDMFDCVFPCRTARFGTALTHSGNVRIKQSKYASDLGPLDPECDCYTCRSYSRAFLHAAFNKSPATGQLLTLHNLYYIQHLCSEMRQSIKEKKFAEFVCAFLEKRYPRQTCRPAETKADDHLPQAKRRRLSSNKKDMHKESGSASESATSGAGAESTSKNKGIGSCTSLQGYANNMGSCDNPRPPMWVRDALLAAGIDIRHLYTSFDEKD